MSSPAPAVQCLGCEFAWNSAAMADGLRALGSCPKCGGELRFAAPAPVAADAPAAAPSQPADERAPHLVLGVPRLPY